MKCYISARSGEDLQLLRAVLADLDVEIISASELDAGALIASSLAQKADCVIAVLPSAADDDTFAVPLEIGVALGSSVPVVVLTQPPRSVPIALNGVPNIAVALDDRDSLEQQLAILIRTLKRGRTTFTQPAARPGPLPPETLAEARARWHDLADQSASAVRGYAFEQWVVWLLQSAGAVVEASTLPASSDRGVDAVAMIPGEEQGLGPVLFEVKAGRLDSMRLHKAQAQLQRAILEQGAGLGVVVYETATSHAAQPTPVPLVLSLSADELITLLESQGIGDVLRAARNDAVHRM